MEQHGLRPRISTLTRKADGYQQGSGKTGGKGRSEGGKREGQVAAKVPRPKDWRHMERPCPAPASIASVKDRSKVFVDDVGMANNAGVASKAKPPV